jgi:tetratricopeptide (TPR) repeat protein
MFEGAVMRTRTKRLPWLAVALLFGGVALCVAQASVKPDPSLEAGRHAYDTYDYAHAAQILQEVAAKSPQNAEVQLLLAKTYYETEEHDAAITSAEKAVALDPTNSVYHEWLGRIYGGKAEHAGVLSAMSLAKKTHKEFETAVRLDERNFSARQALIEFECSAPGIVGGGEEKALPQIQKLAALDAAEGHYAAGNCRRQKKDFATADVEFTKALESHPKSADLIYDIGDYAMKHNQPDRLNAVVEEGVKVAPTDPRKNFYGAVALVLKKEQPEEAERLLREYLKHPPVRNGFPYAHDAHEWMGRLYESKSDTQRAIEEYETALRLDPKSKTAHEALKRLKK